MILWIFFRVNAKLVYFLLVGWDGAGGGLLLCILGSFIKVKVLNGTIFVCSCWV